MLLRSARFQWTAAAASFATIELDLLRHAVFREISAKNKLLRNVRGTTANIACGDELVQPATQYLRLLLLSKTICTRCGRDVLLCMSLHEAVVEFSTITFFSLMCI